MNMPARVEERMMRYSNQSWHGAIVNEFDRSTSRTDVILGTF